MATGFSPEPFYSLLFGLAMALAGPWVAPAAAQPQPLPGLTKAVVEGPVSGLRPEGVIFRYAAFMSHGDYPDAYGLLSPKLQQQLPYQTFVARYGGAGDTLQVLEMVLQPQTSDAERLDYRVLMTRNEATTRFHTQEQEFALVPPPSGTGYWRIDRLSS